MFRAAKPAAAVTRIPMAAELVARCGWSPTQPLSALIHWRQFYLIRSKTSKAVAENSNGFLFGNILNAEQCSALRSAQVIRRVGKTGDDFLARFHFADADVGIALGADGVRHFQFLRALELLVGLRWDEWIIHGESGGAQIVDQLERNAAQRFILDGHEYIHRRIKFWEQAARLEQLQQHHVAHAEAERGEITLPPLMSFTRLL